MGGPDVKVATVDVESGDNMATLPVSRSHTVSSPADTAEKNNAANKEMELKNVIPKPLEKYAQFERVKIASWNLIIGFCLLFFLSFVPRENQGKLSLYIFSIAFVILYRIEHKTVFSNRYE